MSKPAARIGDMTAHGGTLTVGFPTVLIGNMPAARIGDMHVCPMMTPGTPPIPHVGGPVTLGSPTVLIGNMPAARMGDMLVCVGPPDTIVMGAPTVLIGEAGGGGAGGAGGGATAVAVAALSAAHGSLQAAEFSNVEATERTEHWIEIQFVDKAGLPISGVPYHFTDPDGNESEGTLPTNGTVARSGLANEGEGSIVLRGVYGAAWAKDEAEVGEEVKLTAKVEGVEAGTEALFQVFKRDLRGPDVVVEEVAAEVQGEKAEAAWALTPVSETESAAEGYSSPEYFFEVQVDGLRARSGVLRYRSYIEIELRGADGRPAADEPYSLHFSDGTVRAGKTDAQGKIKEKDVPPVDHRVTFTRRSAVQRLNS